MTGRPHPEQPPYVGVHIDNNRLVRICPDCKAEIAEQTDENGAISNHFLEHWEAEHPDPEPPKRLRLYLLAMRDGKHRLTPEAKETFTRNALKMCREQLDPEHEYDWEVVPSQEDLPAGAPFLITNDLIVAGFGSSDPTDRQVRWYERTEDGIKFTPSEEQINTWKTASERHHDAASVLCDRRSDKPELDWDNIRGAKTEAWDTWYQEVLAPWQKTITKDLDEQWEAASGRFWRGGHGWHKTAEDALIAAEVNDEEIAAHRQHSEALRSLVDAVIDKTITSEEHRAKVDAANAAYHAVLDAERDKRDARHKKEAAKERRRARERERKALRAGMS